MKSNPLLIQISDITLLILLLTPFFFVSCGAFQDDNSQPTIEAITAKTLIVGDETTVEVTITDADLDDTHIMSAASDDTTVATVSVMGTTLTIEAITAGTSNITVAAMDDSGQDNAAAIAIVFSVTVDGPWVGTWSWETVDGQSLKEALEEDGSNVYITANSWIFNDDGTMEAELATTIEAEEQGLGFSTQIVLKFTGTYSLSNSNYTLIMRIEGITALGPISDMDEDTGRWHREGTTLILFSDTGETLLFKRK